MPDNFYDAAKRHQEDAEYLLNDQRLANADQLFGLSAECALKAILSRYGIKFDKKTPENKNYRAHINDLWAYFVTFANDRISTHYAAELSSNNPFGDWDVNQRYKHRSVVTLQIVEKHKEGSTITMRLLQEALLNGDIHET